MICCNLFAFTYLTPIEICQYVIKFSSFASQDTQINLKNFLYISIPASNDYGFIRIRDVCIKQIITTICKTDKRYFNYNSKFHLQGQNVWFTTLDNCMKLKGTDKEQIRVILNTSNQYILGDENKLRPINTIGFQKGKVLYDVPGHSFVNLHIRIGEDTITTNIDDGFNNKRITLDYPIDTTLIKQFADISSLIPIDIMDLLNRNIIMRNYKSDSKDVARKRKMVYTAVSMHGWKSSDSTLVDGLNKLKGGHTAIELFDLIIILIGIIIIIVVAIYVINRFTKKRPCQTVDVIAKNIDKF
jgi:hypothetical protein